MSLQNTDEIDNEIQNTQVNKLNPSNQKIPFHILTLTLSSNNSKTLPLYLDSNPGEIAFEFCKENNLSFDFLIQLKEQISSLINEHNNQKNNPKKQKDYIQYRNSHTINDNEISFNQHSKNSQLTESKTAKHQPTKLFPYEFSIQNTYLKTHQTNANLSMTRAQSFNKHLITSQSSLNNNNNIDNINSHTHYSTTQISPQSTFISETQTSNNSNIFNKLFSDSKFKPQAQKQPFHFSQKQIEYPKRPNSQQKLSSFNMNKISILQAFNTLQQIDEKQKENECVKNKNKDYSRSYILHTNPSQGNSGIKMYSFRPNITPIKPIQKNPNGNTNTFVKTIQIQKESKSNKKPKLFLNKQKYTTKSKSCNKKLKKGNKTILNNNCCSLYQPLKERKIQNHKKENHSIEKIRKDALENLFNVLKGSSTKIDNNILNRESIQLKNIPQSIQNLIEYVIDSVINKNEEFTLKRFLKVMDNLFMEMSPESKQFIINNYKTKPNFFASRHNSLINNNINIINNTNTSHNIILLKSRIETHKQNRK